MVTSIESKKELLKEKVVALVKDFVKTEGGITHRDLIRIFGPGDPSAVDRVMTVLDKEKVIFLPEPVS